MCWGERGGCGKCVGEWGEVRNHVGRGVKGGMEMGDRCGEM